MRLPALTFSLCMALAAAFATPALAAQGQDFPDTKCTCKGCGDKGGDVHGQCATVCKDKTVYDKGSESYDYCKAKARTSVFGGVRAPGTMAPVRRADRVKPKPRPRPGIRPYSLRPSA